MSIFSNVPFFRDAPPAWAKGDKGDNGDKGDKGDKGDTGAPPDLTALTTNIATQGSISADGDISSGSKLIGEVAQAGEGDAAHPSFTFAGHTAGMYIDENGKLGLVTGGNDRITANDQGVVLYGGRRFINYTGLSGSTKEIKWNASYQQKFVLNSDYATYTFTTSDGADEADGAELRVILSSTSPSSLTLAWPDDWTWITAKPTTLASGKKGRLLLYRVSAGDENTFAEWIVQS